MKRDARLAAVVVCDDALLFESSVPISVFGVDRTDSGGPPLHAVAVSAEQRRKTTTTAALTLSGLADLDVLAEAGVIVVPTWSKPETPPSAAMTEALRDAVAEGATVMGLCLGAYALGHAGLLDGRRAITHWRWLDDFAQRFPKARVDNSSLYIDEGTIITSAGTAAGLDACLHYIRREWGAEPAAAVAKRMVVAPHRSGNQNQFAEPAPPRLDSSSIAAIQQQALEMPVAGLVVDDLVAWYRTSRRTFDRDFRAATGQSPLQWLLHQRVFAAQQLLETTALSVEQIARHVGFSSAISLRPHFRRVLGVSPQQYRQAFTTTAMR